VLTFFLLRPTPWASTDSAASGSPTEAFMGAFRLLTNPDMLLLCITFAYTGLVLTFWSGVYGSCIGFTKDFGDAAKSLVGLHGIVVGVGEILGGLTFGIFGRYLSRYGHDAPVILGFFVHIGAFAIAFVNLPFDSPFGDTESHAYIKSNPYLAIVGSFLLGLGDACYNTQIYAIIGSLFRDNSAQAFAIFKFFQSALAAGAFFYSSHLELSYQLLFLAIFCVLGTITFCIVERKVKRARGSNPPASPTREHLEDNSCALAAN
jgi:MFS family permease